MRTQRVGGSVMGDLYMETHNKVIFAFFTSRYYQVVAVKLPTTSKPAISSGSLKGEAIKQTVQKENNVPYIVAEFRASRFKEFKTFVLGAGGGSTSKDQGRSRRAVG